MMNEINTDSNVELPIYLKLLSDVILVGVLIPVCGWFFFVFYYKQLPPAEYKYQLSFIWFAVMLQFPPVMLITLLLIWILKALDTPVLDRTGQYLIAPVKELYAILLDTSSVKRILIWPVLFTKLSLPFFVGWGVFGWIIPLFAKAQ